MENFILLIINFPALVKYLKKSLQQIVSSNNCAVVFIYCAKN